MLFNSTEFLLIFLPIVLIGFYLLRITRKTNNLIFFIIFSSLVFYAWWNVYYLALILFSITINFIISRLISYLFNNTIAKQYLLILGISINLSILAYYKYANFFIETLNDLNFVSLEALEIILPLGISFFTFQQIAYLIDLYYGRADKVSFLKFTLFVTFFPQLIAGPIVHHSQVMSQYNNLGKKNKKILENLSIGIFFIGIGLFKKVFIAEKLSYWSDLTFYSVKLGTPITFIDSWSGLICFSLQIYFDFSAYSDMAIGLARLFGIDLPINFNSPYKSNNIIDFWRRWHITLSSFLKNYLYIPMGGNRKGVFRKNVNLFTVMFLGGLWHGANWNFIFWGVLHGFYLIINNLLIYIFGKSKNEGFINIFFRRMTTFLFVSLAWVFFRTDSFIESVEFFKSLFGFNGFILPSHYKDFLGLNADYFINMGFKFGTVYTYGGGMQIIWIILLMILVMFFPNSQSLIPTYLKYKNKIKEKNYFIATRIEILLRPSIFTGLISGIFMIVLIIKLLQGEQGEFIYFQF